MTNELISLTLQLKLADQHAPFSRHEVPSWWGRAAQQLFLATLSAHTAASAGEIHDEPNRWRPYTVSSLIDYSPQMGLQHQARYSVRFTGLRKEVSDAIFNAAQGVWALGQTVQLDRVIFKIVGHEIRHERESQTLIKQSGANGRFDLGFGSPTFFKSREQYIYIPLPGLVFNNLLQRWNAFSATSLSEEVLVYAKECLAISGYALSTQYAEAKGKAPRWGAVGWATYRAMSYDPKWQALVNALASYAFYAGVGAGTTMGMGQCTPYLGGSHELHRKRH